MPGVPMVVGVTGHRDPVPDDVPGVQEMVGDALAELRRNYPHTSLIALSPLAEGCDRIFAEVALATGAQLVVPMPLPQSLTKMTSLSRWTCSALF